MPLPCQMPLHIKFDFADVAERIYKVLFQPRYQLLFRNSDGFARDAVAVGDLLQRFRFVGGQSAGHYFKVALLERRGKFSELFLQQFTKFPARDFFIDALFHHTKRIYVMRVSVGM